MAGSPRIIVRPTARSPAACRRAHAYPTGRAFLPPDFAMCWMPVCLRHRLQHKHTGMLGQKGDNHRKANYDLDQFTEENPKNPSLNSTLRCLKVVDMFHEVEENLYQ